MEKENRFKLIIPSYNNEEWVEYNLASVLNQRYTNFEVLYIDDASTDATYEKAVSIVEGDSRFKIIHRTVNKGATYNYFFELDEYLDDDEDIVVHLDGDDWFFDDTVLENLNNLYNEKDVWMTYGKFFCYTGDETVTEGHPQNTSYSDFVHKYKLYRRDTWRASHLRTYRTFLYKKLDTADLYSKIDNQLFWHASDLAFQYPYLEMCPVDKIGVVDFPTHIYNQTPKNQERTQEREHVDNNRFEVEIRNRKHYREGLSGEKLPQVNVIGDFRERNSVPTTFSYVYGLEDGEFDITLLQDGEILKYIDKEIQVRKGKIVADIHEAPHLLDQYKVYDAVKSNSHLFDRILTFDPELLELPNAVFRNGGYEVVLNKNVHTQEYPMLQDSSLMQLYPNKTKLTSFITSTKVMTEGHRFRLECTREVQSLNLPDLDFYGKGIREIKGKIQGLKDYRFSVAIENGIFPNYFTEKILDCFLTGTIPIYRGCNNIGDFFDLRGFFTFDTVEELVDILKNLTEEDYIQRYEYVQLNFNKALDLQYNNDTLFTKFLKDLI